MNRTLAAALLACAPLTSHAQSYPTKPVMYVVPFTPGGSTDVVGRTVAQKLGPVLGQTVVVENRPGAAGAVGASYVAKAKPDGYTLLGGTVSTHAINASLYRNLPYDPVKDFEPITLVGFVPNALFSDLNLKLTTVKDLIELLKRDASKRTFASSGAGTSTHLAGELFADLIGVKVTHVAYKGSPQALQDVVGGQVPYTFDQLTGGLALAKAGRLKLLAVTTPKRSALAPEVPTMIESGVKGFESVSWQAIYAPKGTPKPVLDRLNTEIVKIAKSPDTREKMSSSMGLEVVGSTPGELTALMQKDIPRFAELVRKSGATVD